jgi:acetoin utilization protein AcuB
MLVAERMSRHPVVIDPKITVPEALQLMRSRKVRRLPVIDEHGKMVGIVSEMDLLYASPSPSVSMNMAELNYQLSRTTVADVMTKDVITVTEYTPLEEAALLMADHKIGGLPVVRDGRLVGIITETDMLKVFLELFGAREPGVRITMLIPEEKGVLASVSSEVARLGGNIVALGTFQGEQPTNRMVVIKVADVDKDRLARILTALGMEITDIREMSGVIGMQSK